MRPVLQSSIPYDPSPDKALPGVQPLDPADWLIFDEAFAGQMAARDALLRTHLSEVVAVDPDAHPAAVELLNMVLAQAYPDAKAEVTRADGVRVPIDRTQPMYTLGRLVQQDFCILEKRGAEHVLTAAVLCFPASWTLSEKFLRPLTTIHDPVESYDTNIARRVQRLFDGVRVGRPLWRYNVLRYADPALYQPRPEAAPRDRDDPAAGAYLRSERQSVLRLPLSDAVVFGIHTYVLARQDQM